MLWTTRRLIVAAISALVVAGGVLVGVLGPTSKASFAGVPVHNQTVTIADINRLLTERGRAIQNHDEKSFLATIDQTDPRLVAQERMEYRNLTKLPLETYRLVVLNATPPNFLTDVWSPGEAITREETQISGVDKLPVGADEVAYDVSVQNNHVVITGDHNSQPWARTALDVRQTAHFIIAIDHRNRDRIDQIAGVSEQALSDDKRYFANNWLGHFLVFATSDRTLFNYAWLTGGGADFIGYVTSFPQVARGDTEDLKNQTPRVVIDLDPSDLGDLGLLHVLRHEFTHAASQPVTRPATPTWILEGYAEDVASQAAGVNETSAWDQLVTPLLSSSRNRLTLPASYDAFYTGDIGEHYDAAFLAFRFIEDKYGVRAARNFYVTAQGGGPHLADAFKTLHLTETSFLSAWNNWAVSLVENPDLAGRS